MTDLVGLAWELTSVTGWGVYGRISKLELLGVAPRLPSCLQPARLELDPVGRGCGATVRQQTQVTQLKRGGRMQPRRFSVVKTLTSTFSPMTAGRYSSAPRHRGHLREHPIRPELSPQGACHGGLRFRLKSVPATARHVQTILQGVDPSLFHPAVRHKLVGDRFIIFSGGKAEHRKGQDIVLAAFKRFQARHPEALLLTAWQSPWPDKAADLAQSPHGLGAIPVIDGVLDVGAWAIANGLPPGSVIDVGLVANDRIPRLLGQCDCAVFSSRYESGTNLPAMEAMACGLPVILSDNTGHRDILDPARCFPLRRQTPVSHVPAGWGSDGWGESDVDELVSLLEAIHADRTAADARGAAAAEWIRNELSWTRQTARFVELLASA